MLPPNPADLATEHAAALAEDAGRVFQYLARVARAAAELAASEAEESAMLAPLADDPDTAADDALWAWSAAEETAEYADHAEAAAEAAEGYRSLGYAAEDAIPEARVEVARDLARALSVALAAITEETPL